jgi:poly(3-hydroxybutyrate) depolymerase
MEWAGFLRRGREKLVAMVRLLSLVALTVVACGSDAQTPADAAADEDAPALDAAERDSAGCRTGLGLAEGEHTFTLEGLSRRFVVRLPTGYVRDRAWPVVLALHGNGGSVAYWDGTSGDRNIRGVLAADAILVVLEAREGNWRDYALPATEWPARLEAELRYVDEVVTRLRTDLCVRDDGLFAMGFSGGGSFSGVLACRRPDIRAIAGWRRGAVRTRHRVHATTSRVDHDRNDGARAGARRVSRHVPHPRRLSGNLREHRTIAVRRLRWMLRRR